MIQCKVIKSDGSLSFESMLNNFINNDSYTIDNIFYNTNIYGSRLIYSCLILYTIKK
jgi:hypothetical protein